VRVPGTGAGTLLLELAQEWDRGTSLFTRSGTENETTFEYSSGCLGGQVDSFLKSWHAG
jgi:hypothetical protein